MSRTTSLILIGLVAFIILGISIAAAVLVIGRNLRADDQSNALITPSPIVVDSAAPTTQATSVTSATDTALPGTATSRPGATSASPTAISVSTTSVQYVMAITDANVRSGPGASYSVEGWLAAGQTAVVTGISGDNGWWKIACPDDSGGSCWVIAGLEYTLPVASPATTPPTTAVATTCTNGASLVADLTIPDGTQFAPNTGFNKTWRIKNTGTCSWDHRYKLVHAGGHLMGATSTGFPLPDGIVPGQTVDLTVSLVSPAIPETYQGDWKLQSPQGQFFGVGQNNSPFWVKIIVTGGPAVTISGLVYQDGNQNGVFDPSEIVLGNREVWLVPGTACHVQQDALAIAFSGGDGRYTFKGDYSGSYCLGLVGDNGLDDVAGIAIVPGQVLTGIDLLAPLPGGSISGFLWNDYCLTNENGDALDGNCVADGQGDFHADGMIQPSEGYIAGVTTLLQLGGCSNNNNVKVAAVTDASGRYFFGDLQPGTYCVSLNATTSENAPKLLPGDWTFPNPGIGYQEITLLGFDNAYPVNFGWDYQIK